MSYRPIATGTRKGKYGEPVRVFVETANQEARFAFVLLERLVLVDDGTPSKLVARAFELSELAHQEAQRRGWFYPATDLEPDEQVTG